MYSPVTGKSANVVDLFVVKELINGYKTAIGIDVSPYFQGMDELPQYACPDTGMRFFYPDTLAGSPQFYTALENREAYYSDWKWEYDEAFPLVEAHTKVLDIGCGRGAFLKKLKGEKACDVTGLEFNPNAYAQLCESGIRASMEPVEIHSEQHEETYDVVTFFQVLEHISAVESFLTAAIKCLKKNGLLILAVPNNEPYLFGFNKYDWLNLPPHHMGWWNAASLQKLSGFFPIKTERIQACPFRDYNNYLNAQEVNTAILNPGRLGWLKATRPVRKQWIQLNRNNIPGVFIMAVYKKT
jgi:2-polyprenyl-3-methyl-5-hydroxy-6-metoxy-1,4-benzoquinol methylase